MYLGRNFVCLLPEAPTRHVIFRSHLIPAFFCPFADRDNLLGVTLNYTRALRVPLTLTTLRDKLTAHPDYPSLLSVADVFNQFNIENAALQIDAEQLALLQVPYIAHLYLHGGTFVYVERTTNTHVTYRNHKHERTHETREDFLKKWSGVVFIAESKAQSGENNYQSKRQTEQLEALRWPLITAGFALFTILGMYQSSSIPAATLLLLKSVGVVLTMLLLSVQYGKTNDFTDSLCHLNQKTDCNHILTSSAAKITNWLGWSEVGFFYFMAGWVHLCIQGTQTPEGGFGNGVEASSTGLLWLLSLLALPYTFWSIWYQWQVAKQWCPLCVAVQVVVWVEVCLLSFQIADWHFDIAAIVPLLMAGISVILLWLIVKPLLLQAKKTEELERELHRFKNNPILFKTLLWQQKQMPPLPADLQPIVLGNPYAQHTIVMVTNPYCGPCANAHGQLEQALLDNESLKAEIVFAATNHENDRRGQIARHLLSLNNSDSCQEALASWYASKDYEIWAKQYPSIPNNEAHEQLEVQHRWCTAANIEATPTFFIDGFEIPQIFGLQQSAQLITHLTPETA